MASRRDFLKNSSLAAAGGLCLTGVNACTTQQSDTNTVASDKAKQRKALIDQANFGKKKAVSGADGMAISSHPLVTNEAIRILKDGGNAADAALAAAITQTVVEPHMTTLTGVFSILYYDAKTQKSTYINGSANAPLAFDHKNFDPDSAWDYMFKPQGAIVPGFWGGFEKAHEKLCTKPIKSLMANAIDYARNGFEVHPFLFGEMFYTTNDIGLSEQGREIYMPNRRLVNPGELIYQKRAADLLERLSEEGSAYFYHGGFAKNFADLMRKVGGLVTEKDFEHYEALVQEPASGTYREFDILASPPPDFGGSSMINILQTAEHIDFAKMGSPADSPDTALFMNKILDECLASKDLKVVDGRLPDLEKMLSKERAAERYEKVLKDLHKPHKKEGRPVTPPPGSNHLTVIDKEGNVATVLHSCMCLPWCNSLFVEGIMVAGAGVHYASGVPNAGDKINAGICPSIILKNGKPVLASGSPSISLMQNIFQTTVQILDFNKMPEEAVELPRWGGHSLTKAGAVLMEVDCNEDVIKKFEEHYLIQKVSPWNWSMGSFEGIFVDPKTGLMHACGDPRRNSMAMAV